MSIEKLYSIIISILHLKYLAEKKYIELETLIR